MKKNFTHTTTGTTLLHQQNNVIYLAASPFTINIPEIVTAPEKALQRSVTSSGT